MRSARPRAAPTPWGGTSRERAAVSGDAGIECGAVLEQLSGRFAQPNVGRPMKATDGN